jgi:hypothetical protein
MCLIADTNKCNVAERDIVVYKYVARRVRILDPKYSEILKQDECEYWRYYKHDFVWVSPYRLIHKLIYNVGETITDANFQSETKRININGYYVVEGGLHVYGNELDAIVRASTFVNADGGSGVLKCIIPKGTRYWKDKETSDYCAETLKIESELYTQMPN